MFNKISCPLTHSELITNLKLIPLKDQRLGFHVVK